MTQRLLVVEDDVLTQRAIVAGLRRKFPASQVDAAGDIRTARALIAACSGGTPYDVVILDFKLPSQAGEHPEVDETLCRQASDNSFVIHITSFVDDPQILNHVQAFHAGERAPAINLIRKDDPHWALHLVIVVRQFFAGRAVDRALDAVFSNAGGSATLEAAPSRCPTHALGDAQREVIAHWPDLDERSRERVREYFIVEEEASGGVIRDLHLRNAEDNLGEDEER